MRPEDIECDLNYLLFCELGGVVYARFKGYFVVRKWEIKLIFGITMADLIHFDNLSDALKERFV